MNKRLLFISLWALIGSLAIAYATTQVPEVVKGMYQLRAQGVGWVLWGLTQVIVGAAHLFLVMVVAAIGGVGRK